MPKKICMVFGTRPEAIKMAPVIKELQKAGDCFSLRVVVTAQHREMLDQVLDLFGIRADYDLNIMQPGQSLPDLACRILSRLTPVFARERPDLVMVHGDTATTFLGALAAFYLQIPVAHVEAGLRTYRPYSPFPEEMNRRLTGALAAYHFAPTRTAAENLLAERVPPAAVMVTGNTVIDALLAVAARPDLKIPRAVADIPAGEKVILVTTHRRENLGEPLRRIYSALRLLLADFPGLWVVFPVHRNPLVRKAAKEILGDLSRVRLLPPLEYGSFVALMRRADLVLTDSGGIQEEAPALGKPVLVYAIPPSARRRSVPGQSAWSAWTRRRSGRRSAGYSWTKRPTGRWPKRSTLTGTAGRRKGSALFSNGSMATGRRNRRNSGQTISNKIPTF